MPPIGSLDAVPQTLAFSIHGVTFSRHGVCFSPRIEKLVSCSLSFSRWTHGLSLHSLTLTRCWMSFVGRRERLLPHSEKLNRRGEKLNRRCESFNACSTKETPGRESFTICCTKETPSVSYTHLTLPTIYSV